MTEINQNSQIYNQEAQTPLYYYANNNSYLTPNGQIVNVSAPNSTSQGVTSPIYQYPQTSLYEPKSSSNPQETSGVNIYIYNPSGVGGQNSVPSTCNSQVLPQQAAPIANTSLAEDTDSKQISQKTKDVVELTDDYIKTLENYLRSDDKSVRRIGIQELIKRYEEDSSRYDDEALTALLNIALQDADPSNRLLAMSPIAASVAHGNNDTITLLQNLANSDKLYGQEAKMATDAMLKASQQRTSIPDYSPEKREKDDDERREEQEEEESQNNV